MKRYNSRLTYVFFINFDAQLSITLADLENKIKDASGRVIGIIAGLVNNTGKTAQKGSK